MEQSTRRRGCKLQHPPRSESAAAGTDVRQQQKRVRGAWVSGRNVPADQTSTRAVTDGWERPPTTRGKRGGTHAGSRRDPARPGSRRAEPHCRCGRRSRADGPRSSMRRRGNAASAVVGSAAAAGSRVPLATADTPRTGRSRCWVRATAALPSTVQRSTAEVNTVRQSTASPSTAPLRTGQCQRDWPSTPRAARARVVFRRSSRS
jgi:hypothetical protein